MKRDKTTTTSHTMPLLLATLIGVAVAACGGDDNLPSAPNPGGGGPPPPPPQNQAPVAVVSADPGSVPAGDGNQTVVTLDGSASSDPDGEQLSYSWTVPSGTFVNGTTDSDPVVEVTFPGAAPYTVTLVVDDSRGGSDSAQFTVGLR